MLEADSEHQGAGWGECGGEEGGVGNVVIVDNGLVDQAKGFVGTGGGLLVLSQLDEDLPFGGRVWLGQ